MNLRQAGQVGVKIEALEPRTLFQASLTVDDVQTLLGQAGSQGRANQAVVVSDREGIILGIFSIGNATAFTINKAVARARTAAFFQSTQNAFTTRTARFIIQDHFPPGIPNTPGGPLYGVEFSSLVGTDVLLTAPRFPDFNQQAQVPGQLPLNISGDPGGIPLYKNGEPVGGIGVAGDGRDIAVRQNFLDIKLPGTDVFPFRIDNPGNKFFNGTEENDFDEAVALAGANGYMAPRVIRATQIFLDGLRLPFTKDKPATGQPNRTLDQLIADGVGSLKKAGVIPPNQPAIQPSPTPPWPTATYAGNTGQNKNTNPDAPNFGVISSDDDGPEHLTFKDVNKVISNAVAQALTVRAAIREPIGQPTIVHIAVVDIDGDMLGVFRMGDGTNFSFDVAVQKARTAAFLSDNRHAFTARGVGFVSQRFFPPGIDSPAFGPLFELQDNLSLSGAANFGAMTPNNPVKNPLRNGITIFPGGAPLYKNGVFVGAVGVSGDGVDQDDIVTFAGTKRFQPPSSIRCDVITDGQSVDLFKDRVQFIADHYNLLIDPDIITDVLARLDAGLKGVRLPYVKFPRNPTL